MFQWLKNLFKKKSEVQVTTNVSEIDKYLSVLTVSARKNNEPTIKCPFCNELFYDVVELTNHGMLSHKKTFEEMKQLSICLGYTQTNNLSVTPDLQNCYN